MSAKKNVLANMIISLIIGIILGTLLVILSSILPISLLITWGLIIVGIITIISNVPALVTGIMNIKKAQGIIDLIFAILGIILGAMMIFMQNEVITIILAAYLIVFPIVRIILARKGWKDQIKEEWVKILIGALLIMFLPALMGLADSIGSLILLIGGWVVIGLSVILFAISLITFILAAKKAAKDAPVETTAEEK